MSTRAFSAAAAMEFNAMADNARANSPSMGRRVVMRSPSLWCYRQRHSLGPRAQTQHTVVCRYEQRGAIFSEGHVGRGDTGEDAAEQRAIRCINQHAARTRGEQVALSVDLEPVGHAVALLVELAGIRERAALVEAAVRLDAIGFPDRRLRARIGHVQRFEIG